MVKEKDKTCMFLWNGNTAFFENGEQNSKYQMSWVKLYFEFLEKQGLNPLEVIYILPNGRKAKAIKKTDGGYTWDMLDVE